MGNFNGEPPMHQMPMGMQMGMHQQMPPNAYGFGGMDPGGGWGMPPGMDPDDMGLGGDDY